MADSATVRIEGPVLNTDTRSGIAKASGNAYSFTNVRVLVGDMGVAEVRWADRLGAVPTKGELVDVIAEVGIYGNRLSCDAIAFTGV